MINPYSNVDWNTTNRFISCSHIHLVTQSDFELFYSYGMRHFPVSLYQPANPNYPLSDFYTNVPPDALGCPNSEKVMTSNINYMMHFSALGSLYESYGHNWPAEVPKITWQEKFDNTLGRLQYADGGGIVINHPVWSGLTFQDTLMLFDYDEKVLGIEVYNDASVYGSNTGWADDFWNNILATGRFCLGFFVVDWPSSYIENKSNNYGRNVLLVPALTEENALKAYRTGAFYGALIGSGLTFTDITANANQVAVATDTATEIKFISDKGETTISASSGSYTVSGDVYVRIEAIDGTGERIFSQPIIYREYSGDHATKRRKRNIVLL